MVFLNTKTVGLIPVWAIHSRFGLYDPCESLPINNILWNVFTVIVNKRLSVLALKFCNPEGRSKNLCSGGFSTPEQWQCCESLHFYFVFPHIFQVLLLNVPRSAPELDKPLFFYDDPIGFACLLQRVQTKSWSQLSPAGMDTTQNALEGNGHCLK